MTDMDQLKTTELQIPYLGHAHSLAAYRRKTH